MLSVAACTVEWCSISAGGSNYPTTTFGLVSLASFEYAVPLHCPRKTSFANRISQDIIVLITSSCARLIPGRRKHSYMNGGLHNVGLGRSGRDTAAENRLIDELNEEWDDY